ncbi:MAG: hypothetical protein ACPGJV_11115 [Bacteriovoracaceae bacterium]
MDKPIGYLNTQQLSEIILFQNESKPCNSSQLKDVLNFLKWRTYKQNIDFAHLCENDSLISNLSLEENLQLEGKEFSRFPKLPKNTTELLMEKIPGPVDKLLSLIPRWNILPQDVTPEIRKLVSLLKVLSRNTDYLILENPDKHLDETSLCHLKEILMVLTKAKNTSIFMTQINTEGHWKELITSHVRFNKNHLYIIEELDEETASEAV